MGVAARLAAPENSGPTLSRSAPPSHAPLGDVGDIRHRQEATVLEPIQDDQVEFVDLVQEQFAHGERYQREFIQWRQIVLLGRPQDGEVHQVHRRVRLQQPSPGALAGMRLTGNQQHAQAVAHAVDLDHGAVVDGGDLALERIGRHFDHGRAGTRDRDVDRLLDTDRHALHPHRLTVAPDGEAGGSGRMRRAEILDGDTYCRGLADDAVARCLDHPEPAIGLFALRRDQHVERCTARLGIRDVVHLSVGYGDGAGQPRPRNVGQCAVDAGEQPRSRIAAFRHRDGPKLEVG